MKFLTYLFPISYFFLAAMNVEANKAEPTIAAVVNDKSILTSDLNARVKLFEKMSGAKLSGQDLKIMKEKLMNSLIEEELQRQMMKKHKLKVEKSDIMNGWSRMEKGFGMEYGELKKYLAKKGIPERVVENQIKAALGWRTYIQERYSGMVKVSDQEVERQKEIIETKKNQNQALLSEIVIRYKDEGEKASALKKVNECVAKINSGVPFSSIAQQYSQAPSAATGGDIGWVNVDQLDPKLKSAVASMGIGHISKPIATQGSYHVLGLRERQKEGSLGEPVEYVSFYQVEFQFPIFGGENAMQDTYIHAQETFSQARSCKHLAKLIKDRPRVRSQLIQQQRMDVFPDQLRSVLRPLKAGQDSELMNTGQGFIGFKMCDRKVVMPHAPTQDEIRASLLDHKYSLIAEREIRSLRRSAHIDLRIKV